MAHKQNDSRALTEQAAHSIEIVGGGFSGLMVLTHLVRESTHPLQINWCEPSGDWGLGTAYGKSEQIHLLNVRANRMGAFAGQPQGFWEWLEQQSGNHYAAEDFVPRPIYGDYLQSILRGTLALAAQKNIVVMQRQQAITSYKKIAESDAIVLACGTPPPREFAIKGDASRYLADPWRKEWPDLSAAKNIGIIGTGLTAVDVMLSLKARGFSGRITAISRHGWLPQEHHEMGVLPKIDWLNIAPNSALGLLVAIKNEVKKHGTWHEVIDSLRPVTQALWQRLPVAEKQKVLRRLFALWNIHRHRMAPEIGASVRAIAPEIIAADIRTYDTSVFDVIINCTGPDFALAKTKHPLLRDLLERGLIVPDEVGLGMLPDPAQKIYPLGALTIGTYFESFAIPELREQCKTVAQQILQKFQYEQAIHL
jgi:uncharacterized NAD(P)/FAD-binding protein YdhS